MPIEDREEAAKLAQAIATKIALTHGDQVAGQSADAVRAALAQEIDQGRKMFFAAVVPALAQDGVFDRAIDAYLVQPATKAPAPAEARAQAEAQAEAEAQAAAVAAAKRLAPPRSQGLEDVWRAFRETKKSLDAALHLQDIEAANTLSQKLDAQLPMYLEAGRYYANRRATMWSYAVTALGLVLVVPAVVAPLMGHVLWVLLLMPGVPALGLGLLRLRLCVSIRHRALPPPALRQTGTEGQARILEVVGPPVPVGWDLLDRGRLGKLSKWRLEVTLPGQAPYEAVVETFRGPPPNNGAFPVYVDPHDPQLMFVGETRYA